MELCSSYRRGKPLLLRVVDLPITGKSFFDFAFNICSFNELEKWNFFRDGDILVCVI